MPPQESVPCCPHCAQALVPIRLPDEGGWEAPFHLACFNDDCPYYVKGWEWMESQFGVKSSYRYRLEPISGASSPLPVWSPTAVRDRIIEADVTSTEVGSGNDEGDKKGLDP